MSVKEIMRNRKAFFHYEILDRLEVGIVLVGTEVKSIRAGKVDLSDAFCLFNQKGELLTQQMKIEPYALGTYTNHSPRRPKKLLLHKREAFRLRSKLKNNALSLIPLRLYFKNQYLKIELGLAKPKKIVDKEKLQKLKDQSQRASFEEKYRFR